MLWAKRSGCLPERSQAAAAAALRRDIRLAAANRKLVAARYRTEARAVLQAVETGGDPELVPQLEPWVDTISEVWANAGQAALNDTTERLTGQKQQQQQLVALVAQIVRYGAPASLVTQFVADQAAGIVTTTRRRIHTVLREVPQPAGIRQVTRALRRLYNTEFVATRAGRDALDAVLRSTIIFEDGAVRQVAASTGRPYLKRWVTQGDDRVRPTHSEVPGANGLLPLDSDWKVGGVLLRYPRDPAGPPGEVKNCRCWVEHVRA